MLCWNAYVGNFNTPEIEPYNIFSHYGFKHDAAKAAKKFKNDKDAFADEVRKSLMYFFWSKCEWEIILNHWPSRDGDHGKKIDVYDQVKQNWDIFIDWLWGHRKELIKEVRDEKRRSEY